jgi:hypothetical protein
MSFRVLLSTVSNSRDDVDRFFYKSHLIVLLAKRSHCLPVEYGSVMLLFLLTGVPHNQMDVVIISGCGLDVLEYEDARTDGLIK